MVLIYNIMVMKLGLRGYMGFPDSVYRNSLPHHTYMSGVFLVLTYALLITGMKVKRVKLA